MKAEGPCFYIFSNSGGCPQNQLDGAHVSEYLGKNGYTWTYHHELADIIIINGCAYNLLKETQTAEEIKRLSNTAKPGAQVIVSGCFPKIAPHRLKSLDGALPVIAASELHRLEEYVPPVMAGWNYCRTNRIPAPLFDYVKPFRRYLAKALRTLTRLIAPAVRRHCNRLLMYDHSPETYFVRVGEGCLGQCSYCAIRLSRGQLRSKPLKAVVEEVRRGLEAGEADIVLTATDLAAYGRDRGSDLSELLEAIFALGDNFNLLLFYANPRWLMDIWHRLEPIFATGRIHFLHASLNGGSDRVLQGMKRGYSLNEFETLIGSLKRASPATVLQTQVIVGFPGERDEDFEETRSFFRENYFHNVQVHPFSARPGTLAADMPYQVPQEVKCRRRHILYRETLLAKVTYNLSYIINSCNQPALEKA